MNKIDLSKMKLTSKEESKRLTEQFTGYYEDLNKGLRKIAEQHMMKNSYLTYSMMTTPIPSAKAFEYDRGDFDIDGDLEELLQKLKTKYYTE
jgi:hypothetical protein